MSEALWSISEVAEWLHLHPKTVRKLPIPRMKIGRAVRFSPEDVRLYATEHREAPRDLYFVFNQYTGLIKIGIATDVAQRKRTLESAGGVALELLGVVAGGALYEQALHAAFREQRACGEWFRPSPEIMALAAGDESPADFLARVQREAEVAS